MSVYDDVQFKSFNENKIQHIPINEVKENFKEEFLENFNNIRVQDIKNMLYLNPKEELKFDFTFNKQENVREEFFNNNKLFNENADVDDKIEFMLDFIESSFDILTPKIFKQIFEELLGISNSEMNEEDYEMMIYQNFNKYQVNLKNADDKKSFKYLLRESLKEDNEEVNNILPSVNKKEKIQTSTKLNLKEKLGQNKILN